MLPGVIRALGLANAGKREHDSDRVEELAARREAVEAATARLEQLASERGLPADVVQVLRAQQRDRLEHFERRREQGDGYQTQIGFSDEIEFQLIAAERERINELYRRGTLKDRARRRIERELDLRDADLANHDHDE
jgi:hypothetical protein